MGDYTAAKRFRSGAKDAGSSERRDEKMHENNRETNWTKDRARNKITLLNKSNRNSNRGRRDGRRKGKGRGPVFYLKGGRKKSRASSVECNRESGRKYRSERCDNPVPVPLAVPPPSRTPPSTGVPQQSPHAVVTAAETETATGGMNQHLNTTTTSVSEGTAKNETYEPIDSDVGGLASLAKPTKVQTRRRGTSQAVGSEDNLQQLPMCPEIPPGLSESQAFNSHSSFIILCRVLRFLITVSRCPRAILYP